jgi:hypothetical protein
MNKVIIGLLLLAFVSCKIQYDTQLTTKQLSCNVNRLSKEECGYIGITQQKCEEKGCCWKVDLLVPWCFKGVTTEGSTSKSTDATAKSGSTIEGLLKEKMGKIEEKINQGKTEFEGYERDMLSVFRNVNSKIQNSFYDFGKRIRDLWSRNFFYFY